MKLTKKELNSLIAEMIQGGKPPPSGMLGTRLDTLSPEDLEASENKNKIINLMMSGDSASISSAAVLSDAIGIDFTNLVKSAVRQNQAIENLNTDNTLADVDEVIREIMIRALRTFNINMMDVEEEISEETLSDIDMEMVLGIKQNILNAIERAVVQTILAIATGE